ncbi:hypothetical protein K474DRAFT_1667965, partial [Panus rudis PR-1116 ss-1]
MTCRRGQYFKFESNTQQIHRPRGSLSFRKCLHTASSYRDSPSRASGAMLWV